MSEQNGGAVGEFRIVDESDLHVDPAYQRGMASEKNVKRMAKNWDQQACGVLLVAQRKGGKMYVMDGHQRLLAMRARGIKQAACFVFKDTGQAEEARRFISINSERTPVSPPMKFRAGVAAGMEPHSSIDRWLRTVGLEISATGKPRSIRFANSVLRAWRQDEANCKRALIAQRDIIGESEMSAAIHKGFFVLMAFNGVDVMEHRDKIMDLGGRSALLRAINTAAVEAGHGRNESVCARGVLSLINFKKRAKYLTDGDKVKVSLIGRGKGADKVVLARRRRVNLIAEDIHE